MAEEVLTLKRGEPGWEDKYNKLVSKVENLDSEKWTKLSNEGIVLGSNLAYVDGEANGYETLDFGGATLVHLILNLKLTADAHHGAWLSPVATVPDAISFWYPVQGTASVKAEWGIEGPHKIVMHAINDAAIDWKAGDTFIIDKFYLKIKGA